MRERPELEALREAIDAYARAHARDIVAEANEAAQARVRSTLTDALADSMLEHARAELAGSRPTSDRVRSPASRTGESGYYVYGVVTAGTTLPAELAGVDGSAQVELIECGELAAIASRVSLAEFEIGRAHV